MLTPPCGPPPDALPKMLANGCAALGQGRLVEELCCFFESSHACFMPLGRQQSPSEKKMGFGGRLGSQNGGTRAKGFKDRQASCISPAR